MYSSATGVGMTICFLGAILLILTQKSSQKFGDVLGIMVLGFILAKTLCPQRHSKVCFELLKTFRVTLENKCRFSSKVRKSSNMCIVSLS